MWDGGAGGEAHDRERARSRGERAGDVRERHGDAAGERDARLG